MQKIYIRVFFVVVGIYCLSASTVKAEEVLTWNECIIQTLEENPDLITAREKVNEARANKDIQVSPILPQIDFDLSGSRSRSNAKNAMGEYTKKYSDTFGYSLSAQQLVFDGFKTASNISSALKTLQAEGYNYLVTSSDIRLQLRNAFVNLLRAQQLVPLTKEITKRRNQNFELVELRYEAGREHKGALLTAKADLANAQFEVDQAIRNIHLAQRGLLKALGLSEFKPLEANDEFILLANYSEKPDLQELADTNPFLKQLISKKEAAYFDLHSEEADFFPKVYLNGSLGRTNDDWPPRQDEWAAGFTVKVPLFEGGSRISEVKKAKTKVRQTEAEERSGRDSVLFILEETWKDLRDSIDYVSVKYQFLDAGKERAKIARAQYAAGLISFDDWIIIENNLVDIEKTYLNAQANMLLSEAYWIQAIGGTLEYEDEK